MITSFFNKAISLFIPEREDRADMDSKTKALLLNITNFLFFIAVLTQGIVSLINENLVLAGPLLFLSIAFALNYYSHPKDKQESRFQNIFLLILALTFAFFTITGGNTGFDGYWTMFFPILSLTIRGRKSGTYWSLGLLGFLLLFFLTPDPGPEWIKEYDAGGGLFLIATYFMSLVFSYTFQFTRSEVSLEKDRQILESENQSRAHENLINKLSYQIRTPLNNITGVLELLENSNLTDEQRDYIQTIHASTNNLVNVVKNLVVTSKAQSNEPENLTDFNLYTTLNNTLRLFSRKPEFSGTHFNISLSAGIPTTITGNSVKIKQIFLNLINNIIKHNEQSNNFITIEVVRSDGMPGKVELLFRIVTNMVVHPEYTTNREEDFFNSKDLDRINNSRLINQLDMGITLKIIEAEGQSFNILTEPDKTIFEFTLTFLEENGHNEHSREQDKPASQPAPPPEKPGIELNNANILMAEDNISNQQIINLYIKNEVNKVDVAFNGKEVLEKFGHAKYDLILMDIQMPVMDGIKATRKIREIEKSTNSHTPIIAVTANAFPEDRERCMSAGMDGYISKPFQPEELLQLIREHLA